MIFWKLPRGGWSFSILKFILQILGTLNRAFWSWNWYKIVISGFRVCYFQQLYCITIVLHLYLEIMCMHFILSSHHISSHICNHICHKKLQCNFPKIRGLGSKAVWNFSKDSSDLVAVPFPNPEQPPGYMTTLKGFFTHKIYCSNLIFRIVIRSGITM